MYDGRADQVRIQFKENTGTTYPLLLEASSVGQEYGLGRDFYMVIDHRGVVRYRTLDGVGLGSRFNESSIRTAIEESLEDLAEERVPLVYDEVEPMRLAELSEADVEANRQTDAFFSSFTSADAPGGAVIVLRDNSIVYQSAYGLAHLERGDPLTVDHVLHMASVGKQVTGLAIMMLSEEGTVRYDDPVGDYVPELAHWGPDVTVRSLLTHTSGLPDYDYFFDDPIDRSDQPTNADLLAVLADLPQTPNAPGDFFEYSNLGYDLLGVVVERASGQSFPDFVHAHIFGPLGMRGTFSLPNPARRAGPLVAISYTGDSSDPEPYPSDEFDELYGSGSIYTTVGDMALYDRALYDATLVSEETLAEAFQPVALNDGRKEAYGFGWEIEEVDGVSYVAYSGSWLGFNADYVRVLDQHLTVVVLLNRDYEYPDNPRIALQVAQSYLSVAGDEDGEITAVLEDQSLPTTFGWLINYPNPFNAGTVIQFELSQADRVSLDIYDVQGRFVRQLWDEPLPGGVHSLTWDGRDDSGISVATGIYLSRLGVSGQMRVQKMLLLR